MQRVCVYCASSTKIDPVYIKETKKLASILANHSIEIIYGGGATGLMGTLADATLSYNGKITGIIPQFMCEEGWQHHGVSNLIVVDSMHQRKQMMAQNSDAVIALPGGCGTMEELLEIITWKQLGIFSKPIVILNINGYYDHLIGMLARAINENFMGEIHSDIWKVINDPACVIDAIKTSNNWENYSRKQALI